MTGNGYIGCNHLVYGRVDMFDLLDLFQNTQNVFKNTRKWPQGENMQELFFD